MARAGSILVIDDEEIMREILEALLTPEGYDVRARRRRRRGPRAGPRDALRRRHRRRDDAGHGRPGRPRRAEEDRRRPGRRHGHRVRVGRHRRRRDEARRLRLHHQAVQERRSAARPAQRRRAPAARHREPLAPPEPAGALPPLRQHHRQEPADAPGVRPDHPGGAEPVDDPHRRARAAPARS